MVYCGGAKKGSATCERRKGPTGGAHTVRCYWGLRNCSLALRKKAPIGALRALLGWKLGDNSLSLDYSDWYVRAPTKGASSFKVLLSSSRLATRIKESCSMKSVVVANQNA